MDNVGSGTGSVTCGSWIRRPEDTNLSVLGKAAKRRDSSPAVIEIYSFDPNTTSLSLSTLAKHELEERDGDPVAIAVHPNGDEFVCSTSKGGLKLFELRAGDSDLKLLAKELPSLQDIGPQKCLAFSVDGSKFATGGVDGYLRILEWPSLRIILDEPKAHKSIRDMDFSLDSEFLASTCIDGSARIWKTEDGVPLASLTRKADEKIEFCRFSKDGTKPFLFCAVQKGDKPITAVYGISTWQKIGYKRLLRKPVSVMSMSLDGKYLALGSKDGDVCVVDIKKMEICHWSKRLHLGTSIESLEFCPTRRVVLTTSSEWGAIVTKLNVAADWKAWQIYMLLLGLFLASAVLFYIFFENSDNFWQFPLGKDQKRPKVSLFPKSPPYEDQNIWTLSGADMLFELRAGDSDLKLLAKELPSLQDIGPQKCLAFSVDGSKFATGGVDGYLRILEWPSLRIILDEPKAHKSIRDMDFSLDSEFLASTCIDGSARIWKTEDGVPLASLTRKADEKIEFCRFSKDGTKPFLFCAVQKGDKPITAVYGISTWQKIGYKRLLRKPVSVMSMSLDGKYLALGSKDGDVCVVDIKKMEICHWSKRLHLGTSIESLEFCPTRRVVLTTSSEWGAIVTKLNVAADWKAWQIYMLLLGLFLASAVLFYIFFENSDNFWQFPLGKDQKRPKVSLFPKSPPYEDQNIWTLSGADM